MIVKKQIQLLNSLLPGVKSIVAKLVTPRGEDIRKYGDISFDIPSMDVIHCQTSLLDAVMCVEFRIVYFMFNLA